MRIPRSAVTAALAASAVVLAAAPAAAESVTITNSASASAKSTPVYRGEIVNGQVAATLEGGTFTVANDRPVVEVRDSAGHVIDIVPLQVSVDGHRVTLAQEISPEGTHLQLIPQIAPFDPALTAVASPVENQLAMNDLLNAVSIGTSIGSLVGMAIGGILGVAVGFILAGASCVVLTLGCVVTVLPTIGVAGAIGGLAGAVLAGGPTAAAALYEYVTTLNTAPGQSKYAPYLPGATAPEPISAN